MSPQYVKPIPSPLRQRYHARAAMNFKVAVGGACLVLGSVCVLGLIKVAHWAAA